MRETSAFVIAGLASALTATCALAQVDRYGGSAERRPTRVATATPWQMRGAPADAGRTLSWPGKNSAPRPAPVTEPAPQPEPARAAYAPTRVSEPARPVQPAPLPTSIYDAPPPAPAQPVAAAQPAPAPALPHPTQTARRADGPRFYSVHRDFGIAPDAAPIPPQFFGETADLSEPPPPVAWDRRNVTTNGKTTTVVRRSGGSN